MPLPDNQVEFNGLAKPLKKIPETKENIAFYGHATIKAFNNRQTMRCVQTRSSKHADHVGSIWKDDPDIAIDIPAHEMWAYMAKYKKNEKVHEPLYELLLKIICELCIEEKWAFIPNNENPQLSCLASLVLHEYVAPHKFNKRNTQKRVFAISALAREMHMDRKTYNKSWHKRFLSLRPFINKWGEDGYTKFKYR